MATQNPAFDNPAGGVKRDHLSGAFFWLSAFYFVYCIRPEDWIGVPYLAKITVAGVIVGLLSSRSKARRKLKDLPIEAKYLVAMSAVLFLSALLSPVWKRSSVRSTSRRLSSPGSLRFSWSIACKDCAASSLCRLGR
jgi:hypothetical protein